MEALFRLLLWSRISLTAEEELSPKTSLAQLARQPLSDEVVSGLLLSMERLLSAHEHTVDEDDLLLAQRAPLSARARLAVTHRRLNKLVLQWGMAKVSALADEARRERQQAQAGTSSYSTEGERRVERGAKAAKETQRAARKNKAQRPTDASAGVPPKQEL